MAKNSKQTEEALEKALRAAISYLDQLDDASVAATIDLITLRERLAKPLADHGLPPTQVIDELIAAVDGGLTGSAGGRFFGWVIGGSLPAALAADWLTSAWDQNAAVYACSPAAAMVEEVAGNWLKQILGLPDRASFALVTGCQMAHFTCLAAARHAVLSAHHWDVEENGLQGAPLIRILAGDQWHGSAERACRMLGFGRSQITLLPTDRLGRMQASSLRTALEESAGSPTIVILQAGEINTGSFDPFSELIPLAKTSNAWVHVDGAFGLWAAASPRYKHLVYGVDAADSWATDGHKWLNIPYDGGYAFIAHSESHQAAMGHRAAYVSFDKHARDQMDWNPEWSRRARGFSTYAALRQLGRDGVAALIDRCCLHTKTLVRRIGELHGAETLCEPIINQGLVRFPHPDPKASEQDHTRQTDRVIAEILATGEAFFTGSTWHNQRVMRISVCNWQTSDTDIDRTIAAVASALQRTNGARHHEQIEPLTHS